MKLSNKDESYDYLYSHETSFNYRIRDNIQTDYLILIFLNGSRGDGSQLSTETLKTKTHMTFKWQKMLHPF